MRIYGASSLPLVFLCLGPLACGGGLQDGAGPSPAARARKADQGQPYGVDVSGWNDGVDWGAVSGAGYGFAYVKATEGTDYLNPAFADEYEGSYYAGLIRGAYHFALPAATDGATQADFFVDHGGGWSADGQTLPGALDIEYNPYGSDTCYGLSQADMTAWVHAFTDEYRARTGRDAVIYTTADWWDTCTGSTDFGGSDPLWVADYGAGSPALPAGWDVYTIWQYTSDGGVPGVPGHSDASVFNGDASRLLALANGQ